MLVLVGNLKVGNQFRFIKLLHKNHLLWYMYDKFWNNCFRKFVNWERKGNFKIPHWN